MAQNVIINGVTYQNVPEVDIPKSGGGTAKFTDTSDATLDAASKLLDGVTAYANGTLYTGSIETKAAADMTVSGATVTAPAGYYASASSKSVSNGSATAPATISGTSATVSTGTNTLTLSKTVSVTPSVSAGYVSSGTAGNSSVSLTANVTTKAAATITPTTSDQTIASGTYLTGTQTVKGDANLIAGNIKKDVVLFNVTGTYEGDAPAPTPRTATITSASLGSSMYAYASYNNTKYYTAGSTFTFAPGDTLRVYVSVRNSGTVTITVDGEVVVSKADYASYDYTLPDHDIDITLHYGSSSAYATISPPTLTITQNGTYDITGYGQVIVNVT